VCVGNLLQRLAFPVRRKNGVGARQSLGFAYRAILYRHGFKPLGDE
jgi:hypothetical protein